MGSTAKRLPQRSEVKRGLLRACLPSVSTGRALSRLQRNLLLQQRLKVPLELRQHRLMPLAPQARSTQAEPYVVGQRRCARAIHSLFASHRRPPLADPCTGSVQLDATPFNTLEVASLCDVLVPATDLPRRVTCASPRGDRHTFCSSTMFFFACSRRCRTDVKRSS